jgi:hypothetical protein
MKSLLSITLLPMALAAAPALAQVELPEQNPQDETVQVESQVDAAPAAEEEAAADGQDGLEALPEGIAAQGGDVQVTLDELDKLLVERHGKRPEGMDVLNRLITKGILEELATEAEVEVTDAQVGEYMLDLDDKLKAEGIDGGLIGQLLGNGIDPEVFKQMLHLTMTWQELTRLALKLPEGNLVSPGQQNAWMDEIRAKRPTTMDTDPFPTEDDAVVGSSGGAQVTLAMFEERLRNELDASLVDQACTQLILQKVMLADAGEIDSELWTAAIDKELQRRRVKQMSDPAVMGMAVTYEEILAGQGLSLAIMAEDPSVQVTALTTVLARREALGNAPAELGPDASLLERVEAGLLATYGLEREFFDGYFGPRLPVRICTLRAVPVANELVPRSIETATKYLAKLLPNIDDESTFVELVRKTSDEETTKANDGALGVYGRGDQRLPDNIRAAVWTYWDASSKPGPMGPLEVPGGVALFWVGEATPTPSPSDMAEIVESELQRRILNAALPESGIHVFRNRPGQAR